MKMKRQKSMKQVAESIVRYYAAQFSMKYKTGIDYQRWRLGMQASGRKVKHAFD
jgi:hypothetical protein